VLRKLNFTGRKRIPRSRLSIEIYESDGDRRFEADLRLEGLGLPPKAVVFVEAYHRSFYKRFKYGVVEKINPPEDRSLGELPVARPLFRVKVVKRTGGLGRIVASADRIIPRLREFDEEGCDILLPVEFQEMGERLWRLSMEEDMPRLYLNSTCRGLREAARSSVEFLALVYPEVLRRIFTYILREHDQRWDDPEDWPGKWVLYAQRVLGRPAPEPEMDPSEKDEWIEQTVEAFCRKHKVRERFQERLGAEDFENG